MKSLRELYRIGKGPSSSHTMGPALVAGEMSILSDGHHKVSFDTVVKTMVQTGHDLPSLYRETSTGGLSTFVN